MIKGLFLRQRPADILNFLFLLVLTVIVAVFHEKIKNPSLLVVLYSVLFFMQAAVIMLRHRGKFWRLFYSLIFPSISILLIFDSLGWIVHYISPSDIDPMLIRLDYSMFGCYPTVALESFTTPLLTDLFQVAYSSYYVIPFSLGIALYRKGRMEEFDHTLFLIMLCFYLSYAGYMIFPALGPRFTMAHLQSFELEGLFMAGYIQDILNSLEGVKRDAFPSGHTAVALTVVYMAWKFERRLFYVFVPVVAALVVSTVYCRYHYVIDVMGGVALTVITIVMGEAIYGMSPYRCCTSEEKNTAETKDS
ncbi:MAG: phosphatase PAP2 family protein [Nitrospirae bacterium]|nr:phosphatase PAP2 family protein [Nitrospirota bacterium]